MQSRSEIYSFKSERTKKDFTLKLLECGSNYELELQGDPQSIVYFITKTPRIFTITGQYSPIKILFDRDEVLLSNKNLFIYNLTNEATAKNFLSAAPTKEIYKPDYRGNYHIKTYKPNGDHGAIIVGFFSSRTTVCGSEKGSYGIMNTSNVSCTYIIDDSMGDIKYYNIKPGEAYHIFNQHYDPDCVKIRSDYSDVKLTTGPVNPDDLLKLKHLSYNDLAPLERRTYTPQMVADGIMSCLDSRFTRTDWIKNTECIYSGTFELDDSYDKAFYLVNSHGVRYPYHYRDYKQFIPYIKNNNVSGNFIYKMYSKSRSIKYHVSPHSQSTDDLLVCYSDSSDEETI
jgi:hypothetical protein